MSIYRVLNMDAPVVEYQVMHQPKRSVPTKEYVETLIGLHRRIHEESLKVSTAWDMFSREATDRSVQAIRGVLMQFLTTPLQSDQGEIRRLVGDQVRQLGTTLQPWGHVGVMRSTEAQFVTELVRNGPLKNVSASGRKYLKSLGFTLGKGSPPVFESTFEVDGGLNLDVMEAIVRDKVGIYAQTHGKHIQQFSGYVFAAFNRIIAAEPKEESGETAEAVLFFAKGESKYALFRKAMSDRLLKVLERHKKVRVSVWQRKLGLGNGEEFHCRIGAASKEIAGAFVKDLLSEPESGGVGASLKKGHLLLKMRIALAKP